MIGEAVARLALVLSVPLVLLASGCGTDACNEVRGSATKTFNVDFTDVHIEKQVTGGVFQAMRVRYENRVAGCTTGCPVTVFIVANAPVSAGVKKDLANAKEGRIYRVTGGIDEFPDLELGHVTFDELGDPGSDASGEFYATFQGGTTLNGDFCGTVALLEN